MWIYAVLTAVNAAMTFTCIWKTSKTSTMAMMAECHASTAKTMNDMATITARTINGTGDHR